MMILFMSQLVRILIMPQPLKYKSAVGTVELFNDTDGKINCKVMMDIPSDTPENVADAIRNLQYGILYHFNVGHENLKFIGKVYREGMGYAVGEAMEDDGDIILSDELSPDEESIMAPIKVLEQFLGVNKNKKKPN